MMNKLIVFLLAFTLTVTVFANVQKLGMEVASYLGEGFVKKSKELMKIKGVPKNIIADVVKQIELSQKTIASSATVMANLKRAITTNVEDLTDADLVKIINVMTKERMNAGVKEAKFEMYCPVCKVNKVVNDTYANLKIVKGANKGIVFSTINSSKFPYTPKGVYSSLKARFKLQGIDTLYLTKLKQAGDLSTAKELLVAMIRGESGEKFEKELWSAFMDVRAAVAKKQGTEVNLGLNDWKFFIGDFGDGDAAVRERVLTGLKDMYLSDGLKNAEDGDVYPLVAAFIAKGDQDPEVKRYLDDMHAENCYPGSSVARAAVH